MRKALAAAAAALTISVAAPALGASNRCATAADLEVMQVMAVQRQLLVGAQYCNSDARYRDFVAAYKAELYAADRALMRFFKKMKGRGGENAFDEFVTHLANMYSTLSIRDINTFCKNTTAAFDTVLGPSKPPLATFAATQPIIEESSFASCEIRVAGGVVRGAPRIVPVPLPKPGRETGLLPAIGSVVTGTVSGVTGVVGSIFSNLPPFRKSESETGSR